MIQRSRLSANMDLTSGADRGSGHQADVRIRLGGTGQGPSQIMKASRPVVPIEAIMDENADEGLGDFDVIPAEPQKTVFSRGRRRVSDSD